MTALLRGAYTALITPMKENGDPDYDGFRELIRFQIDQGIDGLVPLGTTGETPTLEEDEEERLIRIAVEETKGRLPLIVGTGSNSTKYAVKYTRRARELGVDIALVVTPYYNKPNDEGIYRHFEAVAREGGLPVLIYNIAARTGKNIATPLMDRLSRIPGIIGVKEASGDIGQMGDVLREVAAPRRAEGKPFTVLSGDDALTLPLASLGGDGVISVISNLVPGKVKAMTRLCLEGSFEEARKIHFELVPLIRAAFIETNPVPIKAAMGWAGFPAGPTRLPLGPLSPASGQILRAALEGLNITIKA
jgi:4-hydroxy-tetrahydrodipicolinate synthase